MRRIFSRPYQLHCYKLLTFKLTTMRNSSTVSVMFGVLLLISFPFILADGERTHYEPEPYTNCAETEIGFSRLTVCSASGVMWYHYTGTVDSLVDAEIDKLWGELKD